MTVKKFIITAFFIACIYGVLNAENWYPINVNDSWIYEGYFKSEPKKILKVKAVIAEERKIDGKNYYFYNVPGFDVRFFVRAEESGAYMKLIRYPYPLFKFLSYDVVLKKEVLFVKYPFIQGEKWQQKTEAAAMLWPIVINRKIKMDMETVEMKKVLFKGEEKEAWRVRILMDQGDGKIKEENHWYIDGKGYIGGETAEHKVMMSGVEFTAE